MKATISFHFDANISTFHSGQAHTFEREKDKPVFPALKNLSRSAETLICNFADQCIRIRPNLRT